MIILSYNQWEQWPWLLYLESEDRMRIEIIESTPILSCHACDTNLAVTRLVLGKKIAILLCESCLYELERIFIRHDRRNPK